MLLRLGSGVLASLATTEALPFRIGPFSNNSRCGMP